MSHAYPDFNSNSRTTPTREASEQKQRIVDYAVETDNKLKSMQNRLDSLYQERESCMLNAADHAGNIGLVYRAESNDFYRIVNADERPPLPPRPERPALPDPVAHPRTMESRTNHGGSLAIEILIWALVVPVGAYIGYGLGTLAGLPMQRYPALLWVAIGIGMGAIAGMKALFHVLWKSQGRLKKIGEQTTAGFWGAMVLTALMCATEASLGGVALRLYSERTSFDASDALPYPTAVLLAVAVSTATLIVSAVKAYHDGQVNLSVEDQARAQYQKDVRERQEQLEHLEQRHKIAVQDWEQSVAVLDARHQKQVEMYESDKDEFSNYKKLPDYQALLKYIGRINVLTVQIEEAKSAKDNYAISRGHGKASVL